MKVDCIGGFPPLKTRSVPTKQPRAVASKPVRRDADYNHGIGRTYPGTNVWDIDFDYVPPAPKSPLDAA